MDMQHYGNQEELHGSLLPGSKLKNSSNNIGRDTSKAAVKQNEDKTIPAHCKLER